MAECTIYDKLRYISETKDLIKMAIESQDVEVLESATFRQYAEYITEIRKVSSVNGMQGDVVITLKDLGGLTLDALNGYATEQWVEDKKYLTEHQSLEDYYTKNDIDSKGYITAIPETYITEDELSTQLSDKVSETALNEALKGYYDKGEVDNLIDNVDVTEQLQNYYTKEEIEGKKYLTEVPSEYITEDELADTLDIITELGEDITSLEENKQDKLTQGTGIKIENNVISLDYSYDLFEVVTELPTENINENKIYLLKDTDGGEENAFVEYIYVNGKFEEVGKFKTTVDLTGYATEKWVSEQGFLTEVPEEYVTDTDLGEALDGYATEQWVEDKKYLTEHQSLENYYTKEEVDEAIDNVDVTEQLQNYYTKEESDGKFLTEHQSLDNYYTKEEIEGKKYLQAIPDEYITSDELSTQLSDKVSETALNEALGTKQDVLTEGAGIKIEENVISLDYSYDLVEVVDQLPYENIDKNKLYLIQEVFPQSYQVEGEMSWSDVEYTEEYPNVYAQTTEGELDGGTGKILSKYRSRVTFSGYDTFTMGIGLDDVSVMGYQTQLYVAVGNVNEDLSNGLDDFTTAKAYLQGLKESDFVGIEWKNVTYSNLDPSKTYFVDVWSNAGSLSVMGLYGYSYIALPKKVSTSINKFDEYIYVNNQWEKVGEVTPEVDLKDYYTKQETDTIVNVKQDKLVSSVNIKTINGNSLLGEGDIVIEGGEGGAANIIEITQDEYDAITPEEDALYIITDAPEVTVPTKLSELEQDIEIGKTYTAGDGIKIENDTISLNVSSTVSPSDNEFTLWKRDDNAGGSTSILVVKGSDSIKIDYDDNRTYPVLSVSDKVALKSDLPDNDIYKSLYEYTNPYVNLVGVLPDKNEVIFASTYIDSGNESHTSTIESLYLKTINGVSLMGEGDISIGGDGVVDLSSYYTKTEIDALIGGVETKITEINGMI